MSKTTKIRQSAKSKTCTLRLVYGECSSDETVVLAHIGTKRGMGIKCHDLHSVYACHKCHLIEEDKSNPLCTDSDRLRALEESQLIMIEEGLITVN